MYLHISMKIIYTGEIMDIKKYIDIIRPFMGDKRFTHCVNVSKEAVRLAKKYGADEEKAAIAGVLHDITKEFSEEKQLQIFLRNDIMLSDVEQKTPKLWHAISGSVYIKNELGINDEDIINAVRYHTTARAGMSTLEKVIFLADFTSEERDYPDVDIIRQKAEISLEEGMLYGIQFTISKLLERQGYLSEDAIDAYNEILLNR